MFRFFFSVVIPLYNKENEIKRAINSVLNQSCGDFEIIIIDDGSTDNGLEKVKVFDDPRIRLILQENCGVSSARNRGIKESTGQFIAFLDADDEWMPKFLETIRRLIVAHPKAGIYVTAYEIVTQGKRVRPLFASIPEGTWEGIIPSYFRAAGLGPTPVWTSAVCMPRWVFAEIGTFPLGEKLGEDLDMWSRVALKYPIAFSSYIGAVYFFDADNRACVSSAPGGELPFCRRLQKRLDDNDIPSEIAPDVRLFIARHLVHVASANIFFGSKAVAREVIGDKRVNIFWLEILGLKILIMIPRALALVVKNGYRIIRCINFKFLLLKNF